MRGFRTFPKEADYAERALEGDKNDKHENKNERRPFERLRDEPDIKYSLKEDEMNTVRRSVFLTLLLIGAAVSLMPLNAFAAGTASGTSITNKATINYQVGGVSQTLIESSPTGNAITRCRERRRHRVPRGR